MARANKHYIPGCLWHITHRCHKQEFLLKFAKDRKRICIGCLRRKNVLVFEYLITLLDAPVLFVVVLVEVPNAKARFPLLILEIGSSSHGFWWPGWQKGRFFVKLFTILTLRLWPVQQSIQAMGKKRGGASRISRWPAAWSRRWARKGKAEDIGAKNVYFLSVMLENSSS